MANLVKNPGFARGLDEWSAFNTPTVLEVVDARLHVVADASNEGVQQVLPNVPQGTPVAVAADFEVVSGSLVIVYDGISSTETGQGRFEIFQDKPGIGNELRFLSTGGPAEFYVSFAYVGTGVFTVARNTLGTIRVQDYDGENSRATMHLQNIDATGTNYGSVTQDLDELKDTFITLSLGEVREVIVSKGFDESQSPVTDTNAQRELKWLITMKDTTQYLDVLNAVPNPGFGKLFQIEVPCPDTSLLIADTSLLDPDTIAYGAVTVKESFEANTRSPWNNNPEAGVSPTQEYIQGELVGRNI